MIDDFHEQLMNYAPISTDSADTVAKVGLKILHSSVIEEASTVLSISVRLIPPSIRQSTRERRQPGWMVDFTLSAQKS